MPFLSTLFANPVHTYIDFKKIFYQEEAGMDVISSVNNVHMWNILDYLTYVLENVQASTYMIFSYY